MKKTLIALSIIGLSVTIILPILAILMKDPAKKEECARIRTSKDEYNNKERLYKLYYVDGSRDTVTLNIPPENLFIDSYRGSYNLCKKSNFYYRGELILGVFKFEEIKKK